MLSVSEYRMVFPERTNKNYALKENAFTNGLKAVTLCFFAKDNPNDSSDKFHCPFSYGVSGSHNELTLCTSPSLRVMVNEEIRFVLALFTVFSNKGQIIKKLIKENPGQIAHSRTSSLRSLCAGLKKRSFSPDRWSKEQRPWVRGCK